MTTKQIRASLISFLGCPSSPQLLDELTQHVVRIRNEAADAGARAAAPDRFEKILLEAWRHVLELERRQRRGAGLHRPPLHKTPADLAKEAVVLTQTLIDVAWPTHDSVPGSQANELRGGASE